MIRAKQGKKRGITLGTRTRKDASFGQVKMTSLLALDAVDRTIGGFHRRASRTNVTRTEKPLGVLSRMI
jgi:hypothetical protein